MKFKERLHRGQGGAVRVLNRVVSVTKEGVEYEGGLRHAQIIVRDVGLKDRRKGVITLGVDEDARADEEGEVSETLHRAIAARASYLAQDRPYIQFAAKDVNSFMSKPEAGDLRRARRLGRYLKDNSKVVFSYKFRKLPETFVVWSDTDFAGCRRTRRSTSGGVITFGSHCLKTCSSTQDIAPSSGKTEFYGIVKAGSH